jgi:hypothetical protein
VLGGQEPPLAARQPLRKPDEGELMLLGGVDVEDRIVRQLANIVNRPLAHKLEKALLFRSVIVGLTRDEMETILTALESAPAELHDVRDLLLSERQWRLRERL